MQYLKMCFFFLFLHRFIMINIFSWDQNFISYEYMYFFFSALSFKKITSVKKNENYVFTCIVRGCSRYLFKAYIKMLMLKTNCLIFIILIVCNKFVDVHYIVNYSQQILNNSIWYIIIWPMVTTQYDILLYDP